MDGSFSYSSDDLGPIIIGGILCDYKDNWIFGFSAFIGHGSIFSIELWTFLLGINLVLNHNCLDLIIESNKCFLTYLTVLIFITNTILLLFSICASKIYLILGNLQSSMFIERGTLVVMDLLGKLKLIRNTSCFLSIPFMIDFVGTALFRR